MLHIARPSQEGPGQTGRQEGSRSVRSGPLQSRRSGVVRVRTPPPCGRPAPHLEHAGRLRVDLVEPHLQRLHLEAEVARQEAAVQQLSAIVERRRAASEEGSRRRLDLARTSGLLDRVLSAYRDQIDGVALPPARTATASASIYLRPSLSYHITPHRRPTLVRRCERSRTVGAASRLHNIGVSSRLAARLAINPFVPAL